MQILEVKSPNDRLSNKQILWIGHLRALGVDASVCHVEAVGGKRIAPSSASTAVARVANGDGIGGETAEGDAERGRQKKRRKRKARRNSGDDFL